MDSNGNFSISGGTSEYGTDGAYVIYNEPYHSFYFVKKDAYSLENLGGAEFRLYGASDSGNLYDETVTSLEGTGFVTFENLESGSYILEETKTPDHDGITYVADGVKHLVTVAADGTVTMDGLVIWPYAGDDETGSGTDENDENNESDADGAADGDDAAEDGEAEGGADADAADGVNSDAGAANDAASESMDAAADGTAYEGTDAAAEGGADADAAAADGANDDAAGAKAEEAGFEDTDEEGGESSIDGSADGSDAGDTTTVKKKNADSDSVYVWYNVRNRGQITITKRWADDLTNEQRMEPVVYISTEKPVEGSTKAYFRRCDDYPNYHSIIAYAGSDTPATSFKRNTTLTEEEVIARGAVRIDMYYYSEDVEYKIYGWVEDDGTFYWWTKAEVGVLPHWIDHYFYNESSLESIDWSGIAKDTFWTGVGGPIVGWDVVYCTDHVRHMISLFEGCSSIVSLDISWLDTTQIDGISKAYMDYAFGEHYDLFGKVTGRMEALKYITIGENFELTGGSNMTRPWWKPGIWRNNDTGVEYDACDFKGILDPGTYEYLGIKLKYAVQIYGIQQDEDEAGNKLGLSFGPATKYNFRNAYVTHTYVDNGDGTYKLMRVWHNTSTGKESTYDMNVTRTAEEKEKYDINLHDMSWAEIAALSATDPTRFRDCMLCGDTKSVEITLNSKLSSGVAPGRMTGDGAGAFEYTIADEYLKWNASYDNGYEGHGYAGSRIRATLNGADSLTGAAAGEDVLDAPESVLSCIEGDLQNLIAAKKVKYSTGSYNGAVYDKLWLLSLAELDGGTGWEGFADSYPAGYQKFNDTESMNYVDDSHRSEGWSTYWSVHQEKREVDAWNYSESNWWLRTASGTTNAYWISKYSRIDTVGANSGSASLNFGFCLK